MFGGPVVVEDRDFQVIAYSRRGGPGDKYRRQTILDRQTPHEWIEGLVRNGLLKHLRTTRSPIRLEADALVPGAVRRLVSGVVHDSESLGVVVACEGDTPLSSNLETLVVELSELAAPSLLERRAHQANLRDPVGMIVADLLREPGDPTPLLAAWGLSGDVRFVVAALEPTSSAGGKQHELGQVVAMLAGSLGDPAVSIILGRATFVIVALPGAEDVDSQRTRERLQVLCDRVELRLDTPVIAAISTPRHGHELCEGRSEVERVLEALRHPGSSQRIASLSEVSTLVTLNAVSEFFARRPDLAQGGVAEIRDYDLLNGTAYAETLASFLNHFGNIRTAAQALSLHPNSFRYRLRRITDLFNLQLDDPNERLVLALQLHCLDHFPESVMPSGR